MVLPVWLFNRIEAAVTNTRSLLTMIKFLFRNQHLSTREHCFYVVLLSYGDIECSCNFGFLIEAAGSIRINNSGKRLTTSYTVIL